MHNTSKAYLITAIILISFTFRSKAQTRYGLKIGVNANTVFQDFEEAGNKNEVRFKPGFQIGVNIDIPLSQKFSIQTGGSFNNKGYSISVEAETQGRSEGYHKTTYNYLEAPILVAFKMNKFQLFLGPYIAFGVGGRVKYDIDNPRPYIDQVESYKLKPKFGTVKANAKEDYEGVYNAFDYGLNAGIGFQAGVTLINLGYSYGMENTICQTTFSGIDADEYKTTNQVIFLSFSFLIGD